MGVKIMGGASTIDHMAECAISTNGSGNCLLERYHLNRSKTPMTNSPSVSRTVLLPVMSFFVCVLASPQVWRD